MQQIGASAGSAYAATLLDRGYDRALLTIFAAVLPFSLKRYREPPVVRMHPVPPVPVLRGETLPQERELVVR